MSEETALAVVPKQSPAKTGVEDYDVKPAVVQLMQTNHLDKYPDAVVGAFRNINTGKNFVDEKNKPRPIKLILLAELKQRVYFPTNEPGVKPLCRSMDGLVPITGDLALRFELEPQADDCADCKLSDWSQYNIKGSPGFHKVPKCKEKPRMVFLDTDDEMPYVLTFTAMSIAPFRALMKSIASDIKSDSNKNKKNPSYTPYNLYDYTVEMSSQKSFKNGFNFNIVYFGQPERAASPGGYLELFSKYVADPREKYGDTFAPDDVVEGQVIQETNGTE